MGHCLKHCPYVLCTISLLSRLRRVEVEALIVEREFIVVRYFRRAYSHQVSFVLPTQLRFGLKSIFVFIDQKGLINTLVYC